MIRIKLIRLNTRVLKFNNNRGYKIMHYMITKVQMHNKTLNYSHK